MPPELDLRCALIVSLASGGTPSLARLNMPLRLRA